jgi:hypothetical protein
VLIFDQFEEVLTMDPVNDRAAKHAFFADLGTALRSPRRWAVFAMREEFVARLAPYVRAVPTRMKATFQLDLLGPAAAMAAAQQPARAAGVEFTDAAARRLIDDLRQVQGPGRGRDDERGARAVRRAGAAAGRVSQPVGAAAGRRTRIDPATSRRSATSIRR